jgi:hypothetical protein
MIKSTVDKVCRDADKNKHVVYVKIYDDKNPDKILTRLCVPFIDQEQFEEALEEKKNKYLQSISAELDVKALAEQSIAKLEKTI